MPSLIRFSGIVGLVLLMFGILGALIVGNFTDRFLVLAHILVGAVLLAFWFLTIGLKNMGTAGQAIVGRRARYGYNVVLYSAVFVGLLVVANVFVSWNNKRWDLTEQGIYSLSEKSVKTVEALQQPLRIVGVKAPNVENPDTVDSLLKLYSYHNKSVVKTEMIDAKSKPVEMQNLGMKPGNLVYVSYGEGDKLVSSRINEYSEQAITNAIIKLTRGAAKKIYYVQGHGEPGLESADPNGMKLFAGAMDDENLKVEGLMLIQKNIVPEDAAAVILASPQRPLQQAEKDALIKYADAGGRLVIFADAENQNNDDVRSLAQHFGIEIGKDVIVDEGLQIMGGPLAVQFVAGSVGMHDVTTGLTPPELPVFMFSTSVVSKAGGADKVTYTDLVKSGPKSWAERNLDLLFNSDSPSASKDPEDLAGPVAVAVAYEKNLETGKAKEGEEPVFTKASRVVVFGDSTWASNAAFNLSTNRDLALNLMNWAVGIEGGVSIGPKQMRRTDIAALSEVGWDSMLAGSFVAPELLLLFGLFVWWRRRTVQA